MKKIFSFFAICAVVLGMASCGDGNDPQASQFDLVLNNISWNQVTFSITPANDQIEYFYVIRTQEAVKKYSNTKAYIEAGLGDIYGSYNYSEAKQNGLILNGNLSKKNSYTTLNPDTKYVFIVFAIDKNFNVVGDVAEQKFITFREGFVDLGLPSGILWRSYNEHNDDIDADYFNYQDAYYRGNLPDSTQWKELRENCTWNYQMSENCFAVVGPNGNSITLPLDGGMPNYNSSVVEKNYSGFYWSRNAKDATLAYDIEFSSNGKIQIKECTKKCANSVRLLDYNPNK